MQRRNLVLDESKPVWRTMLTFLVPLMLSNILQSASATFTSIFLGRLIGVGALAAASAVFPLLFFIVSFYIGVSSGSTVLIGQAYGAHDDRALRRTAGTTVTFGFVLGVLLGLIGWFSTEPILAAIGTPAGIFADATAYARTIFATLPIILTYLGYTSFLRGIGDVRTPFAALIGTTTIGVAIGPLLIAGLLGAPRLGVIGAPLANAIASLAGTIGLLLWLERRKSPLAPSHVGRQLGIDARLLRTILRIGIPTGIQLVLVSLAEIAVISFVNAFGPRATAAYGAVNQVASYVQFPAVSIGIAASIFGAQSIGARRFDRLGPIVRAAIGLNFAIGGTLITIAYLLDREIISLFVTDEPTIAIAVGLLRITLWSYVIFGSSAVLSGLMRSSGAVLWPTVISVSSIWLVEVPVAWFLSHGRLGLSGVWVAYPVAFTFSLALQSFYYFVFWRRRPITALLPGGVAERR